MTYVIAIDAGTTRLKACLFEISSFIRLIEKSDAGYALFSVPGAGMEQDAQQWWAALCQAVQEIVSKSGIAPEQISGISICAQMMGLVLVDRDGVPVRRPMNYLDHRATEEQKRGLSHGVQISGYNIRKVLSGLILTKSAPLDPSDPLWKYKWVETHEPEHFSRVEKWLDVKDYLNFCCTGKMAMTEDTAFATMLYENFAKKRRFSSRLMRMYGVNPSHMPKVVGPTDIVGSLTPKAAAEMGLVAGIPVFGGGGDATCIPIGSGYGGMGKTHVYIGTSGWVSTVCKHQPVDPVNMIASLYGAEKNTFNYHAEMKAAGKCYEWVCDHIALDEIQLYAPDSLNKDINLYHVLDQNAQKTNVGADGVLFAPWLAGERCPISASHSCGMFFNIGLHTEKADLIRAVLEGICFHINWMIERHEIMVPTSSTLRFVGGSAMSPLVCQILADITGKKVETIPWPQNAGAVGAAVLSAVGLGLIPDIASAQEYIPVDRSYAPIARNHALYKKYFQVYKKLYSRNKKLFSSLRKAEEQQHERI